MTSIRTNAELLAENEQLRYRLEESEAIVDAIRNGIVDAVVVGTTPSSSVYTLEGADRPYRLLVEAMQQGVAVLSELGVVLYCNPCLAGMLRVGVETLIGGTLNRFVAVTDHGMWFDLLKNAITPSEKCEVHILRDDETMFPAALVVNRLPLRKLCILVTDLSQQKQYESLIRSKVALRLSETRYRRLFETAKDGILILDTDTGRITDANPFMSELLGYTYDHFLEKELWEIGVFSDRSANEAAVRRLQEEGYLRYEHLPLETADGKRVEVEIVANSYREGDISVIQCNIRDITARVGLEAERNRLEQLMREQAAAMEDLHRRKDEFLAMLSHELRNPLSPIASALQLLSLQKQEDPLQYKARTIIERQVGQLTRLIDELLEVSRITTGRIHLKQERIDINKILDNAVETVRPLLNERQHELTISLAPLPVWVFADAARMEQVVVNLLTNAAKFTEDFGNIWLSVEQEGHDCVLRVRDTGVGISTELLPHIFDLFTQSDRSLDRSQGGLGIGLALVQRLVEKHNGQVEVFSLLGKGSEFVVRMPVMEDFEAVAPRSLQRVVTTSVTSLRVLVVDDNEDAAQMLGMILMRLGHEVLTVHDGPSALVAAVDFLPHVILLDIGLPEIDGYEVAKRIRLNAIFKDVVLVAMTGYGQDSDRQRSANSGFDHHMVKPPDFIKLQEILATISKTI